MTKELLKDRLLKVLREPADKKYTVRVKVDLELSQPEFCAFLIARDIIQEFLMREKPGSKMDSEFFRMMLSLGCREILNTVKGHVLENLGKFDSKEMEDIAGQILDLMKQLKEEKKNDSYRPETGEGNIEHHFPGE